MTDHDSGIGLADNVHESVASDKTASGNQTRKEEKNTVGTFVPTVPVFEPPRFAGVSLQPRNTPALKTITLFGPSRLAPDFTPSGQHARHVKVRPTARKAWRNAVQESTRIRDSPRFLRGDVRYAARRAKSPGGLACWKQGASLSPIWPEPGAKQGCSLFFFRIRYLPGSLSSPASVNSRYLQGRPQCIHSLQEGFPQSLHRLSDSIRFVAKM